MLHPFLQFPQFFFLSFYYVPLLLRVTAGLCFAYTAYIQIQRRDEIAELKFPIIGGGAWIAWACIVFNTVIGIMLFVGWYTQIAALVGALSIIKVIILKNRYSKIIPWDRSTLILLLVMLISLLMSGAGALAFDLPL